MRHADDSWARGLAHRLGPDPIENPHRLPGAVLGGQWVDPSGRPVAVLLVPLKVLARDLEPVTALLDGLGWPLVGVVTYKWPRWLRRRGRAEAPHHDAVKSHRSAASTAEAPEQVTPALDRRMDATEGPGSPDTVESGRPAGAGAGTDAPVGGDRQHFDSQQEVFHR